MVELTQTHVTTKEVLPPILRLPSELRLQIAIAVFHPGPNVADLRTFCCVEDYSRDLWKWYFPRALLQNSGIRSENASQILLVLENTPGLKSPYIQLLCNELLQGFVGFKNAFPRSLVAEPMILAWYIENYENKGKALWWTSIGIQIPRREPAENLRQTLRPANDSIYLSAPLINTLTKLTVCADGGVSVAVSNLVQVLGMADGSDIADSDGIARYPNLTRLETVLRLRCALEECEQELHLSAAEIMWPDSAKANRARRQAGAIACFVNDTIGAKVPNLASQSLRVVLDGYSYYFESSPGDQEVCTVGPLMDEELTFNHAPKPMVSCASCVSSTREAQPVRPARARFITATNLVTACACCVLLYRPIWFGLRWLKEVVGGRRH